MIKFLIYRPIAVFMSFLACVIIGAITYFTLPVSLLPDIPIPDMTVQVSMPDGSARDLENAVVSQLRGELMQVGKLQELKSIANNEKAEIRLRFEHGTDIDLAFIEVNEKIDAAMNSLPRNIERPRVTKYSATDLPVVYLNLSLKNEQPFESSTEEKFIRLSEVAENIIKRRIEQLPEVTMVDITGLVSSQVQIEPNTAMMKMAGITTSDIELAINSHGGSSGNVTIREGYYEYLVNFSSYLRTVDDIKNIFINKDGRVYQLKDFCNVSVCSQKEEGFSFVNGRQAISLAVIKHASESMDKMKSSLQETIDFFKTQYPEIDFFINRNQTDLLDYTIENLKQSFFYGFILIFIVAFLLLGDLKSPIIIAISMITSLVICFQFFYYMGYSLNIISLSGLILALGMMIDSSIIITENISQYKESGTSIEEACIKGTTEVITPMLSSTLTTIAVFVPLIFMSGIAGALFVDQAFSVSTGLLVSYFTGIMLLPILYKGIYKLPDWGKRWNKHVQSLQNRVNNCLYKSYDRLIEFTFSNKKIVILCFILCFPICGWLFIEIPKTKMPEIKQVEMIVKIDWGENIHLNENKSRILSLCEDIHPYVSEHSAYIGKQQYILSSQHQMSFSESEIYLKVSNPDDLKKVQSKIEKQIKENYPLSVISFSPPETIFEKIFTTGEADLIAELQPANGIYQPDISDIYNIEKIMGKLSPNNVKGVSFEKEYTLELDQERLSLYRLQPANILNLLKTALRDNNIGILKSYQQYLPIKIVGKEATINEILQTELIETIADSGEKNWIPLSTFVKIVPGESIKNITAKTNGEYIPIEFYEVKNVPALIKQIKKTINKQDLWNVSFSGLFFSNEKMLTELIVILFISILLMYFILAAQFESFLQPLIVLAEIPIDIMFALLTLLICGHTLNLMSAIGIIVTCGIIINDSILKIDMINELRKNGLPLMEAIHTAGYRRLRAIIMTSLTTILALIPTLFFHDIGSEIQKPLVIAMVSSMIIGTVISLSLIPLIYWFIYQKQNQ